MGGAAFPLHVKLTPPKDNPIDTVILNGAECEPYITCDDQLMRTHAEDIVTGMEIMLSLFPNAKGVVIIEENKPEAIAAMEKACANSSKVKVLPVQTKYPQGGERSCITVVTGKHLKLGMLPADLGCVVDNVATIYAIYEAVCKSTPLMVKGLTVSGDAVKNPSNFLVRIGTNVAELIEHSSITMMLKAIDEDEKIKIRPKQSLGLLTSNNEYWFLTEDGLYEVLMQSRKPIAKQFKKKVKEKPHNQVRF